MQKLTSDDVAGEIYKILRNKNGSSFIVYISPLSPLPSDEEDRAADALWNKIKKRISKEQK